MIEEPWRGGAVGDLRGGAGVDGGGAGRRRDAPHSRLASRHVGPLAGGQVSVLIAFAFVPFSFLHLFNFRPAGGQARGPPGPFTSWGGPQLGVQHTRQQEVHQCYIITI